MESRSFAAFVTCCYVLASSAAAQAVWTVDDDGPADFDEVQSAVQFAAEGDVILVSDGTYADPVLIDGKSLTLQHLPGPAGKALIGAYDPGLATSVLTVENIAASQSVRIRGFSFSYCPYFGLSAGATVSSASGLVSFEDCRFQDPADCQNRSFRTAIEVRDSWGVALARCTAYGGNSPFFGGASAALLVDASAVGVFDSELIAAPGDCLQLLNMLPGGDGIVARNGGSVFLAGSVVSGGAGTTGCPSPAADGGAALRLDDDCTAEVLDSSLDGGAPGVTPSGTTGRPGPPTRVSSTSTLSLVAGQAPGFQVSSPAPGARVATYSGSPGARFLALRSLGSATPTPTPFVGWRFVADPFVLADHGTLPASGTLTTTGPLPTLPPGAEGASFVEQAIFLGADRIIASPPSILTVTGP